MSILSALTLVFLLLYSHVSEEQLALNIEDDISKAATQIAVSFSTFDEQRLRMHRSDDIHYFVYNKKGELKFWTTNDYVPSLGEIREDPLGSVLSNRHGEFVIRSQEFTWENEPAIIVGMITVRRTYLISNDFLKDYYNHSLIPGNVEISYDPNSIPVRFNGETLFSIKCTGGSYYNEQVNFLVKVLMVVLLFSILRILYHLAAWIRQTKNMRLAIFFLLSTTVLFRALIWVIDLPSAFGKIALFDKGTFTYNWFYPTLGDGIIHLIFINFWLVFLLFSGTKKLSEVKKTYQYIIAIVLIVGSYLSLYLFSDTVQILQRNVSTDLDIAASLFFSEVRIAAYLMVILLALFFFLIHFLSYRFVSKQIKVRREVLILHVCVGIGVIVLALFNQALWIVLWVNIIYLFGIHYFKMPDTLSAFRFSSINYLLFSCIVLGVVGSSMIYKGYERSERYNMQRFATFLQLDRDVEGEYILSDIMDRIQTDSEILNWMDDPLTNRSEIANRMERIYLKNYFNDYDFEIYFFNAEGLGISNRYRGQRFDVIQSLYQAVQFQTAYPNVIYDGSIENNKRKKYICFLPIGKEEGPKGFITVELVLKKFSSKRVLPQLLWERGANQNGEYDYAFVVDNEFNFTSGSYEYESSFDRKWLNNPDIYSRGIEKNGYQHLAAKVGNRTTVVSQKKFPNSNIISNFSFLFILLLAVISLSIAITILIDKRTEGDINFSTKIMMYSIASFVVPLILVAAAVLTTTDQSNKTEIDNSNLKETFLIAEHLDNLLNENLVKNNGEPQLEWEVNELALHASRDLIVYDAAGKLLTSSTPEIFDKEIISLYINPNVLNAMDKQGKESVIINESIGSFQYKTSYASINSPDTGELLGVLASPYFGSKNHVIRQQLQVFGNIINIFTFIFIMSIWVAYWVISKLTSPIVQIADKLHDTGFMETNQPIEWHTDDEIGKLVSEYNNMLSKLEATKKELAQTEKEAAWREMAKQVAHEIKNPLTPMKLTIQHLSRIMGNRNEDKRSLDLLLGQIDTLDDIVTSFSHFAKMPTPHNEPFDIGVVLQKSIELHLDKQITLNTETAERMVFGDKRLFGRIFNNLILNAFESMKNTENPELKVGMEVVNKEVVLSFEDKGEGINESIREKIFIPNFSTKDAGSGIGLAVAKRGIEHAGGKIWFESSPEQGTTFFIRLPLHFDT